MGWFRRRRDGHSDGDLQRVRSDDLGIPDGTLTEIWTVYVRERRVPPETIPTER